MCHFEAIRTRDKSKSSTTAILGSHWPTRTTGSPGAKSGK